MKATKKPKTGPLQDLFGAPIPLPDPALAYPRVPHNRDTPRGYAATPGTGPAGETCRTCAHSCISHAYTRNHWKCELIKHRWTHGPGTDIRLKSPACHGWEQHTDFHAGDRVQILPAPERIYHRASGRRPHRGIIRGPSSSPGYFEITIRHGKRTKNIFLPVTRLRYIRSAR